MASSHPGSAKSASSLGSAGSRGSRTPPASAGKKTGLSAPKTTSGRPTRPSDVLNPKTVDPFSSSNRNQSAFASVYSNGGVPCRLVHGSVKHKLAWSTPPESVSFDPVLVTLAEGLKETVHPYTFVARTGFKELLETPNADARAIPLLPKLTIAIRGALAHSDSAAFEGGLDAMVQLSNVVGPQLNPHLSKLLVPVAKRMMDKKFREKVIDSLHALEENGGRDCLPLIKSKVPTYSSIYG